MNGQPINDVTTFQAKGVLYLVGTEKEVDEGIRGCFEHNLGDLDNVFIEIKKVSGKAVFPANP